MTIEETHENLLRWLNKPESELKRKALKAFRRKQKIYTQEDIDYAKACKGSALARRPLMHDVRYKL